MIWPASHSPEHSEYPCAVHNHYCTENTSKQASFLYCIVTAPSPHLLYYYLAVNSLPYSPVHSCAMHTSFPQPTWRYLLPIPTFLGVPDPSAHLLVSTCSLSPPTWRCQLLPPACLAEPALKHQLLDVRVPRFFSPCTYLAVPPPFPHILGGADSLSPGEGGEAVPGEAEQERETLPHHTSAGLLQITF